jgi:hypothetical protein
MLLTALLALPALAGVSGREMGFLGAPALVMVLAIIAPNSMYLVGQRSLYPGWLWRLRWLPALSCLGIGISASNSRAVFEAIIGRPSEFVRTPKRGDRSAKTYAAPRTVQPWIEVGLGLYCCLSLVVFIGSGRYAVTPLLALYAAGFLATGAIGLAEARKPAKTPCRRYLANRSPGPEGPDERDGRTGRVHSPPGGRPLRAAAGWPAAPAAAPR